MIAAKSRSQAHEAEMTLSIAEESALEERCLHMYHWGYPIRIDLLRGMAAAIVEDRERRGVEDASDVFERMIEYDTVSRRDRDENGKLKGSELRRIGKTGIRASCDDIL